MRSAALASGLLMGLQRLVNLALTVAILVGIVLFGLQFVHFGSIQTAWPIEGLHRLTDPVVLGLAKLLHLEAQRSYVPLIIAAGALCVVFISDRLFIALQSIVERVRIEQSMRARRAANEPATKGEVSSEKARAQLYKEYRQIEKQLKEAKKRQCTFLSVDVVGSTGMKDGETEIAITATFRAYEELLKRTFKATKAWKESWTPDGVMICFQHREQAIEAAQTILRRLLTFNEGDNALKTRFDVRCGINEGDVVVFDDSDLEKLVEHVIDVAGHMQKHAKPGTLWLSAELFELLEHKDGFTPTGQEVDGYKTYQWSPA